MIHMPMEPKGGATGYDPRGAIRIGSSANEIRHLMARARSLLPRARGLNNHQGSRVTADREQMRLVLDEVRRQGLFFLDSRTDSDSIGASLAHEMGVPALSRDIFLDHVRDYAHVRQQLRLLLELARRQGSALAIGHPFPETMRAIADSRKEFDEAGVRWCWPQDLL